MAMYKFLPRCRAGAVLMSVCICFLLLRTEVPALQGQPHSPICARTPGRSGLSKASIVIIGDSVDLYVVLDWCRAAQRRSLCTLRSIESKRDVRYHRTLRDDCRTFDAKIASSLLSMEAITMMGPTVCHDPDMDIEIIMVWNLLGVNAAGPYPPLATDLYAAALPPVESWLSAYVAIHRYLAPAIELVSQLLNQPVRAVIFQSLFWDLYRMASNEVARFNAIRASPVARHNWGNEWLQNASALMNVVVDLTLPWGPKWVGWRTSNLVAATADETNDYADWRVLANPIIVELNRIARQHASTRQLFVADLEWLSLGTKLRDNHHPVPDVLAAFGDIILQNISMCI